MAATCGFKFAWIALVFAALGGCAPARGVPPYQTVAVQPAVSLSLRTADTRVRFVFPKGKQRVDSGEFQPDELCYLNAGEFRIDCFSDGSSLNLGPTDSTDLLTDNPMWGVEPANGNKPATQAMRIYGVLFLVAGSIDRLPGTLADYIGTPGPHLDAALVLADLLLNRKHVRFQGHARGGNFSVIVELNDSGRDKLNDAIEEAGESTGATQSAAFPNSPQ